MSKEKSLVEEALIQMKNLEETVAENAKGILASTMKQEIKDLVKESLTEEDEIGMDDLNIDSDNLEDEEEFDNEDDSDFDDEEFDDEDDSDFEEEEFDDSDDDDDVVIDLSNEKNTDNVLKVFELIGPNDKIVVKKDDAGNINIKDNETNKEYMVVGESEEEMFEDDYSDEELMEFEDEFSDEKGYSSSKIQNIIDDVFTPESSNESEMVYEIEMDEDEDFNFHEMDEDEELDLDQVMESFKAKGVGMGKANKFKYSSKPNQGQGFKTKMKEAPKSVGTGKPKFDYKDGENLDGEFKPVKKSVKKTETKESSRTLGAGSKAGRKGGLPKPRTGSKFNTALEESQNERELTLLREKNEEYRKALNVFRDKLNEVAVFNSNLAYATRLFTEHTTTKQEKINILKRFDNVETLKESKNLYHSIREELKGSTNTTSINESVERVIANAPATGSAVNLIESKTYENPQFLRMKDLMGKLK
jgi:hypothetical protein